MKVLHWVIMRYLCYFSIKGFQLVGLLIYNIIFKMLNILCNMNPAWWLRVWCLFNNTALLWIPIYYYTKPKYDKHPNTYRVSRKTRPTCFLEFIWLSDPIGLKIRTFSFTPVHSKLKNVRICIPSLKFAQNIYFWW